MYAVIATEPAKDNNSKSLAEIIINSLKKIPDFKDWRFDAIYSEEDLYDLERPDVIVFSRFLSPNMENIFKHLPLSQPHSRFVLITGNVDTKTKAFIRMAEDYGFDNIVTGRLPGDRPYTLLVALTTDKGALSETSLTVSQEEKRREIKRPGENIPRGIETVVDAKEVAEPEETSHLMAATTSEAAINNPVVSDRPAKRVIVHRRLATPKPESSIVVQESPLTHEEIKIETPAQAQGRSVRPLKQPAREGVLVISSANKGGVGKTTTALTVSVGLSRVKIPTCLVDLDLGGSDIAAFFRVADLNGIEVLNKVPINETSISDVLVKLNDNLYLLPGTMDKSYPYFSREQMKKIVTTLRGMFPLVIADTPPEFWTKEYLEPWFESSDLVLSLVDQSIFSEHETSTYASKYLFFDVNPANIRLVLNKFSTKLHRAKEIEAHFNKEFKNDIPKDKLPRVSVVIPNDWDQNVLKGYRGEVVLEENLNQWKPLLSEIAGLAGFDFVFGTPEPGKKGFLSRLFSKKVK